MGGNWTSKLIAQVAPMRHAGQMPRVDQGMHDLPIGGIPADEEKALAVHERAESLTAEDAEGTEEEHERKKKHPPRASVTGVLRD
jgi:hypothetical protein